MSRVAYKLLGVSEGNILVQKEVELAEKIFVEGVFVDQNELEIDGRLFGMNYIKDSVNSEVAGYRNLVTNGDFRSWKNATYFVVSEEFDFGTEQAMDKFIWADSLEKDFNGELTAEDLHNFVIA